MQYGRLYENGHSSYIRRSVYQFLCAERRFGRFNSRMVEEIDDVFNIDPEVSVNPVTDIFSNETPAPEYLLLLDGLNEVSRTAVCDNSGDLLPPVVFMLMQEIKELLQCPNVRIILTSRSDEDAIGENITRLYLAGVDTTSIRNYLIKGNMDNQTVDSILKNQSLIETLKIPLYLSIYSTLNNIEGVTTQGEIFKLFFSERAEELNVYTCQKRIATIEHNIIDTGSIVQKNRIDTKMQWFMIDFLLPEIAWFMEKQNRFYLDIEEISEIIEPILTVTSDDSVCGRFGKKIFYKYRSASNMKSHTKKIAKKLIDIGDDIEEVTETIVECCVMSLGILQENSGSFGFIHHHIRDYFASIRHINKFRLAVCLHEEGVSSAIDCLKEFQSAPISYEVRRFLGEILGEHHNRPYYDEQSNQWRYNVPEQNCDRSLIVRILDMYRGEFDNDNYAVYNLITILKEIRVDLSGEDFSYLNLEKCTFNRVRLGNRSLGAKFRGSKLNSGTLFPQSHSREICSAKFSPDGKYILTASKDGLAKLWLSDTLVCANTFLCKGRLGEKYEGENIAEFSPDGKYIVTGSFDGTLRIWDTKDFSCIKDWCVSGSVRCIAFNPTCDLMAVTICNGSPPAFPENWQTIIWDTTNFMSISNLHEVGYVSYTPDGRYFVTTSDTKGLGCGEISVSLKIWDAEKINCIKEITISQEQNASYYCEEASKPIISRDGKYIITVSQTGHIRIWEAESYTCIGLLKGHTKKYVQQL